MRSSPHLGFLLAFCLLCQQTLALNGTNYFIYPPQSSTPRLNFTVGQEIKLQFKSDYPALALLLQQVGADEQQDYFWVETNLQNGGSNSTVPLTWNVNLTSPIDPGTSLDWNNSHVFQLYIYNYSTTLAEHFTSAEFYIWPAAQTNNNDMDLSLGAKIGIGAGAGVGGLLLVAVTALCCWRRRRAGSLNSIGYNGDGHLLRTPPNEYGDLRYKPWHTLGSEAASEVVIKKPLELDAGEVEAQVFHEMPASSSSLPR